MKKNYLFLTLFIISLFAVYSLNAESPRKVLAEEWTGGACGWCAYYNPDYHDWLFSNSDWVVPITFESSTPFDSPSGGYRNYFYGNAISGIPSVIVNGQSLVSPSDAPAQIEEYEGQMSPISIFLFENRNGNNVEVTITVHSDEALSEAKLFFAVLDRHINYPDATSNGETDFYFIERGMAPDGHQGINIELEADEEVTYTLNFNLDDVVYDSADDIYCVAWVQKKTTESVEVLQAEQSSDPGEYYSNLTADTDIIEFGNVEKTLSKTFKLTNAGPRPVTIEEIVIENNEYGVFEIVSDVQDIRLGYQDDVEIEVLFSPEYDMDYNARLKIISDDDNKPEIYIDLTGTGENTAKEPVLTINTNLLDFGASSDISTANIVISNDGDSTLVINGFLFQNDEENVFDVSEGDLPIFIEPGDEYEMEIKFTPKRNKIYLALLELDCNDKVSTNSVVLRGKGEGVTVTVPYFSSSMESIDFGTVNDSTEISFLITNNGGSELIISDIEVESGYDVFEILSGDIPPLAAGESSTITMKFKPEDNRSYAGFLYISSNAEDYPEKYIQLMGRGEGVIPSPGIYISDESLDFGTVSDTKSNSIIIENNGEGMLEISGLEIIGEDANAFEITTGAKVDPIPSGGQLDIGIQFTPDDAREYSAVLVFSSNANGGAKHSIPLSGSGEMTDVEEQLSSIDDIIINAGPNPFNEIVNINYDINPPGTVPVNISIYNSIGNKIVTLVDAYKAQGKYFSRFDGSDLPGGAYYLIANVNGKISKLQLILIK